MENSQYSKPEAYLGPYQASTMELLREKSQRLDTGNYFRKKAPLWMFNFMKFYFLISVKII